MSGIENRKKAIEIVNLRYDYASDWTARKFPAVKGISVDVFEGESFGFLGHNGAGKTTTIKCLLGLVKPTSGTLRIFGKDAALRETRTSVGYLPEQPYFYDHLTVRELVEMYACLAGVDSRQIPKAVARALDRAKVSARSKSPMRSLSKGLTQRVALAQAIVADPRLLVLDEPFSGLDPIGRREFKDIFLELRHAGAAIFMSSHILSDVEFLCDRASIMSHGEIKGVFDLKRLAELTGGHFELTTERSPQLEQEISGIAQKVEQSAFGTRFVFGGRAQAEESLRTALAAQVRVESFQFVQGNLEDLFVKLVQFDEANSK